MMMESAMIEVDKWAQLHPDLLDDIAKRMYSYDDYLRLRHTCKQWSMSLPKTPNHKNLWLVLPETLSTDHDDDLGGKEIYHIRMPDEILQENIIRGSCHGFLIIVMISDGALRMLNPFTKSRFDLPPFSTFPHIVAYQQHEEQYIVRYFEDQYLEERGSTFTTVKRLVAHKTYVRRIITSSPPPHYKDCTAVAIYWPDDRLAFCKLGDSGWTHFSRDQTGFQDVIFHGKKIYAVFYCANLYEFDMDQNGVPLRGFKSNVEPPVLTFHNYWAHKYLVTCPNGNLLMVERNLVKLCHHEEDDEDCLYCFRTYKFNMYILNNDQVKQPIWSRTNSLGKYALVLGYNLSTWMLPNTSNGLKGNHIYYTDNQQDNHCVKCVGDDDVGDDELGDDDPGDDVVELAGGHDIGVLDLENGITNQLFPNSTLLYPAPVWLLPTYVP